MKKIFITTLFLLMLNNVFSQITYQIKEVKVNGTSISSGAPIEFGSNTSVTVQFKVQFIKPEDLTIGSVSHVIGTQSPSGFLQLITPESFSLGINNTGFTGTWEKVIFASNYSSTGENYLVSKLTQTSGNPPLNWESNRIPIIKEPTFTLSPTTQNLACGDSSSKSFTVTPANIPSGATVTYQWSNSGWSGAVNSSMSTVTLTPNSGTTLPGSVSVTPYINGVAKPTLTCAVARSPFNPSYTLTGNTQGCPNTSSNYSINSGTNAVVWSLSTTGVASLNTTTGQNIILTGVANGSVQLNATITNACGQTKVFSKTILIGRPVVTNSTITGGGSTAPINTTTQLSAAYVTGATGYLWTVSNSFSNCVTANGSPQPGVILPKFYNGLSSFTSESPIAFVNWGNCPADVVVNCSAINACGNTGIGYRVVSVYVPVAAEIHVQGECQLLQIL